MPLIRLTSYFIIFQKLVNHHSKPTALLCLSSHPLHFLMFLFSFPQLLPPPPLSLLPLILSLLSAYKELMN